MRHLIAFLLSFFLVNISFAQTYQTTIGSPGSGNNQYNDPTQLAVAPNGHLYVVDRGNNRIQVLDGNGNYQFQFGSFGSGPGQFDSPEGIEISPSNLVYVVDANHYKVQAFNLSGVWQFEFGSQGAGNGQFLSPVGIAINSSGEVYVSETTRVQKFDEFGNFISVVGTNGTGSNQYDSPLFIEVDRNSDMLYVTDWYGEVLVYNSSGLFQNAVNVGGQTVDVAISDSHVFVVRVDNTIRQYTLALSFVTSFGGTGGGNGTFSTLASIEVENNFDRIYLNDTGYDNIQVFNNVIEPSSQSSALNFSNVTTTSMDLSWTPGDGANRIVIGSTSGNPPSPADFQFYNGNASFGLGDPVGGVGYVLYNGSGNTVSVSNLTPSTTYYFHVFEYNGTTSPNYNPNSDFDNPLSQITTDLGPTTQAAFVSYANLTSSSIDLSWTNGDGQRRIVAASSVGISGSPANGTTYNANSIFGNGDSFAPGVYIVYDGTGNAVSVSGLSPNTIYDFHVYEYNGNPGSEVYATNSAPGNPLSQMTLASGPTIQASNLSFGGITSTSIGVSWTNGDGNRRILVAAPSPITGAPIDNTSYFGDPNFGGGSQLNPGEYVVYDGTETNVNVTNLMPNTTYEFRVFEYTGTGGTEAYLITSASGNPNSAATDPPPCFADAGAGNTVNWCNDSPLDLFTQLLGTPDAGGTWTQLSGPGSPIITGDQVDLNGAPGGSYDFEYRVTEPSCPDVTAIITVNVTEDMNAGENNSIAFCNPVSIVTLTSNLGGTPSTGGSWTQLSGPGVTLAGDMADFTGASAGSYLFQYDVVGCLGPDFAQLTIDIYEAPATNAGADAEACESAGSFALNGTVANEASFFWTHNGTGSLSNPNIFNPVYFFGPGETGIVTFTLQATGQGPCPGTSDNMDLTITPMPFVNAGGNNTICEGSAWNILDATASNYSSITWTTNGSGSFSDPNALTTTYNPGIGETGIITLTLNVAANGSCSSTSGNKFLTIDPAGTVANPGNQSVCVGAVTSAVNFSGTATSFSWTNDNPSIGLAASGTGNIAPFLASTTGVATITVTPDNAGCAGTPEIFTITVNSSGTVNNPGNQTVCQGSNSTAVIFTGTAANFNWTNDNPSVGLGASGTGNIPPFTTTGFGTANLTVVPETSGCLGAPQNFTITVSQTPTTANAGSDQNICASGTILNGNFAAAGFGTWSIISGTGGNIANAPDPTSPFNGVQGNTYVLRWTIANGACTSSTDDVTITFDQIPTISNAGSDITQCNNANFTLAGNTPVVGAGSWSVITGTATITTPSSPTSGVTGVPAGSSATLRWTISNGSCAVSTDDVILTNQQAPTTANAGADINQCNNGSFTLTANTPVVGTGAWSVISGSATVTTPSSSSSGVTGVPLGSAATLRWTISNGACAASTDDVILTNSATPTIANAGSDINQCNNPNFTLAGNAPVTGTGTWSVISGSATITTPGSPTSGVTSVLAGSSVTLRWTISNGACTASFDDVILTNSATPTVANAGTDINQCNNANFTLAGNAPVTGTGTWSVISGSATITTPASPTSGVTAVPAGTSATLRWTISNGACTASTDDVILTNSATPTIANAGTDISQCNNANFTLAGNAPVTGTGTWSVISGSATITTPASPTSGVTAVTAGTSVTLRWTISNGSCTASTDDVILTNSATPTTANAGSDIGQCANGNFTLAGNAPATGTGTWSVFSGSATITTPASPTSGVTGVPLGTSATLRWTISNGSCTASTDDVILTNSATPTTANAGTDINQCNNGSFTLAGNSPATGTGTWSVFSGSATITTPASPTSGVTGVPLGTSATLRWTISNGSCTVSTDDVIVTNGAIPTTANAGTDISQCNSGNFTLSGNTPSTGTGTWSVFSGTATITTPASPTSGVTGVPLGTSATLRWTITNGSCTASTDDVIVTNSATPTTANAGTDINQCNNPNFTLAGNSPATGTGTWSVFSGSATITTPGSPTSGVTGVSPGTSATLRWTISNGSCTASTDDVIVTNGATPTTANAGTDVSQCNDGNFSLAANSPVTGTGTWSVFSGTATITTPGSPGSALTGVPVGTSATLRWTISNGSCTASTDDVIVTNDASPTIANAGTDFGQCNNSNFALAGNTPSVGTGTWSVLLGPALVTTPSSPTSAVTGVSVGTTSTLQWTISNGVCPSSSDAVVLSNDANPSIAIAGSDISQCNNSSFTLAANTPTTGSGTWTVFSGSAAITDALSPSTGITSITAGTTATLRWTITNGTCTASVDDVILSNDLNPTPSNAGATQTICGNNTILAGNSPATGIGTWSIISGTGGNITNAPDPNSPFSGDFGEAYILRWSISNGSCPVSQADVSIAFFDTPTTALAGADISQCANDIFNLNANSAAIGTGSWSVVSGSVLITDAASPSTTATNVTADAPATIRWSIANGPCVTSFDDIVLVNNAVPTVADASTDQTICGSSTTSLNGNAPIVGTGQWSIISGAGTIADNANPVTSFDGNLNETFILRWTITNGVCSPTFDEVSISFVPNASPAVAGGDQEICNTSTTLSADVPAFGAGSWSVISGPGGESLGDPNSSASQFDGVYGVYTLRWTVTSGSCAPSQDDVLITFNEAPQATANNLTPTIPSGGETNITLTSTVPGTTFTFTTIAPPEIGGAKGGAGTSITQVLTNSSANDQSVTFEINPETPQCSGTTISVNVIVLGNPNLPSVIVADSLALVALYQSTHGAFWSKQSNWLSNKVSTWQGVVVEGMRVTLLDLSSNNLKGTLPLEMSELDGLQQLVLNNNEITGEVVLPGQLIDLDISHNDFTTWISAPVTLETIQISSNRISALPDLLSNPVSLLDVRNNDLVFDDLQPLLGVPGFSYIPQNRVEAIVDILVETGTNETFTAAIAGDSYQWFQNDVPIDTALSSSITFSNIQVSNDAVYHYTVTSSTVPGLTLERNDIFLKVSSLQRDSVALRQLYLDTDGVNWTNSLNWISTPLRNGNWAGVTIQNSRVVGLNLPNNNLSGSIFTLKDVGNLANVNLADNNISALPDLTGLASLQTFNISGNSLQFKSLEGNANIPGMNYSNQKKVGEGSYTEVHAGGISPLGVSVTGTANQYQWKHDGEVVLGATSDTYVLTSLTKSNMGIYECEITNPLVPNLTLISKADTVYAVAAISGEVLFENELASTGIITLLKVTQTGGYDTAAVYSLVDGSYNFPDAILAEYEVHALLDEDEYPDALPTYYSSTIFWEEAQVIDLLGDVEDIDIDVESLTPPTPEGNGIIRGYLEEDDGTTGGRIKTPKRVGGAGVAARRVEGSGRGEETLVLVNYVITNDNGEFEFTGLKEATYKLNIQYPGYPMDETSDLVIAVGTGLESEITVGAFVEEGEIVVRKLLVTGTLEEYNVELWPNPAKEYLVMKFPNENNSRSIRMYTLNGTESFRSKAADRETTIDVKNIASGSYVIYVFENGAVKKTHHLIIE